MDEMSLRTLLLAVRSGDTSVDAAVTALKELPFSDLGFARVDHHRTVRQGLPEVVFGQGKTPDQIVSISRAILDRGDTLLVTRVEREKADAVRAALPGLSYDADARTLLHLGARRRTLDVRVVVVTAGTSDMPVAREVIVTLRACGIEPDELYDCGVAGLHRLLAERERLTNADAIVAVAGMEGALPSVLGGLVGCPVVAVPTSVGYGAHLGGLTTLLSMATTCAAGVVLVNVDNGFGAAVAVYRMLRNRNER